MHCSMSWPTLIHSWLQLEAWWNAYQVNQEKLTDVDLKPVVVFVNTRSGGQQGMKVLNATWLAWPRWMSPKKWWCNL